MIDRPLRFAFLLPLIAAGCVAPEPVQPPPPRPIPVPKVAPPPPAAGDWRDVPLTPGDWRYGPEAGGSAARFGAADAPPEFIVRCDRATRAITLARTAGVAAPATMAITTSAGDRALAVAAVAGPPAALAATMPPADGMLDRIAFSRGRFVVAVTGTARLVLPELARAGARDRGLSADGRLIATPARRAARLELYA